MYLDFTASNFPSTFNLANNRIYNVNLGGEFEKIFLAQDQVIKDLPIGTTTLAQETKMF